MADPAVAMANAPATGTWTEAERATRTERAALYRLLDLYGMSDIANQEAGAV